MKTFICSISLFLIANVSFASSDSMEAKAVCSRLTPEATRDACLKLIPDAHFDYIAVAACDRMQNDADTLECMDTIQDGTYHCGNAVVACEMNPTPALIIKCLDEIADAGIQDEAANVCIQGSPSLVTRCLQAISNRVFTPSELTKCSNQGSGEAMVNCLGSSGQDDEDEKKFRKDQKDWDNWVKSHGQNSQKIHLMDLIKSDALKNLKCVPDKQNSNANVEKQINDMKVIVYKCSY
jgi:hypothetical protein